MGKTSHLWRSFVIPGLYAGWFIWAAASNRPAEVLSQYIPGWFAMLVWMSSPILLPLGQGPLDIPSYLYVALYVSYLIAGVLLPVALHFYPVAATLIAGLVMIEFYWVIPRWREKWGCDLGPES
jgi:hypothetical protein